MDSETAFWKAKYLEQLMLHTQVIMALSQPGAAALAAQQASQAARPAQGQPGVGNGAVSPATVQKWGGDLAKTLRKPPGVPINERQPAAFTPFGDQPGVNIPSAASVDGDTE